MLVWRDAHSGAVQVLAALATVLLTGVLVCVTARYVRLTRGLLEVATAEAEGQRQAAATQRLRFLTVVARLDLLVTRLPEDRSESRIRAALLWKEDDVEQLLALAPGIGVAAAVHAESVDQACDGCMTAYPHVQAFPQGLGLNWDEELPAAAWTQHLTVARTAL